jgi:hypothetical protein
MTVSRKKGYTVVAPGVDVQIAHEDDERAGGKSVDVISYLLERVAYLRRLLVTWGEVDVTCEYGGVKMDPEDVRPVRLRREGGGAGPGLRDHPRQPLDARVVVRLEEGVLRQHLRGRR